MRKIAHQSIELTGKSTYRINTQLSGYVICISLMIIYHTCIAEKVKEYHLFFESLDFKR
jgi:hypothetical protein